MCLLISTHWGLGLRSPSQKVPPEVMACLHAFHISCFLACTFTSSPTHQSFNQPAATERPTASMEATCVQACLRAYTHTLRAQYQNVNNAGNVLTEGRAECLVTISRSVQLCLRESTFRVAVHRRGSDKQGRALGRPRGASHCDDTTLLNHICRHHLVSDFLRLSIRSRALTVLADPHRRRTMPRQEISCLAIPGHKS
jgi:hypothetical protein